MKRKETCNQRPEPQQERNHPEKIIYLTSNDLAQRFRVTERQICKLARIGYLPGIRLGALEISGGRDLGMGKKTDTDQRH